MSIKILMDVSDTTVKKEITLREFLSANMDGDYLFRSLVAVASGGAYHYYVKERPASLENGAMIGILPHPKPQNREYDGEIVHVPLRQHLEDRGILQGDFKGQEDRKSA